MLPRPPTSTLFPYTTLFRSTPVAVGAGPTFISALQKGSIDGGMTTDPTVTTILDKNAGKILLDMRTPEGSQAALGGPYPSSSRSEEHTSELQSHVNLVCRLL